MEPIPESITAAEELGPFSGTDELLPQLVAMSDDVQRLVPDCVGLSLASRRQGITFTLVSSGPGVAVLDAGQYLGSGPCMDSIHSGEVVTWERDDAHEDEAWELFRSLSAAWDVASTLTLPILGEGPTAGTVNLYASSEGAFDGHHQAIALLLGAWAEGAVTDADLAFTTRRLAEQAPQVLSQRSTVTRAGHVVADALCLDEVSAAARLDQAARRAGISTAQLAEALLQLRP